MRLVLIEWVDAHTGRGRERRGAERLPIKHVSGGAR